MNRVLLTTLTLLSTLAASISCSRSSEPLASDSGVSTALRPLTESERLEDFETMVTAIRENYGPLEFKEKRFGYKFEDLVNTYRPQVARAGSDLESLGLLKQLLANFKDGHVSLNPTVVTEDRYTTPIVLTPVEDKVLVAAITDPAFSRQTGIEVGDELVEVDGRAPLEYLPTLQKYESLGNSVTDRHLILRLLQRPAYITELKPVRDRVEVKLVKADGRVLRAAPAWKIEKGAHYLVRERPLLQTLTEAYSESASEILTSLDRMGNETPFFVTDKSEAALKLVRVRPSKTYLSKYGLRNTRKVPPLFAGLYRFDGKSVLMIRISKYMVKDPKERIAWYKAVLDEWGRLADVLVIDQTHNPGGLMDYATEFMSIFADQQTRNVVNFLHADRRWLKATAEMLQDNKDLNSEERSVLELGFALVEAAYDKGLKLTQEPWSLTGTPFIKPADFTFRKPVLLLADELSGSCGDILPMLMKANGRATLFGQRTMGLGGNVEPVLNLPMSQASLNLTRGFFYPYSPEGVYDLDAPVENNGVVPHQVRTHTVGDVRGGYVEYIKAVSKAAVALVP